MSNQRRLPDDPIKFIQDCIQGQRIFWTYHVNMRLSERFLSRESILEAASSFEIVEEYPTDKYFPSYLLLGRTEFEVFHALIAVDVKGDNIRVVTAYRPSSDEWVDDYKTRRQES